MYFSIEDEECTEHLRKYDIDTQKWDDVSPSIPDSEGCYFVIIDGKMHCLFGDGNSKHYVLDLNEDEKPKPWEVVHEFKGYPEGMMLGSVVYMPDKKMLWVLGGFNIIHHESDDVIFRYSVEMNLWETLPIKLPQKMQGFGCICTSDERYIITLGGQYTDYTETVSLENNPIYIFDTETLQIYTSSVQCPEAGGFQAFLECDEN